MTASPLLVVDPDPTTRQLLRDFLARAGFRSDDTPDLDGALARLAGGHPAAVVLHDGIGGAAGLEVLQSLRAHHPELPVVFIAEDRQRDRRAAAARLAATACVEKPFRMGDLLAAVIRTVHGDAPPARPSGVRGFGRRNGASRRRPATVPRERTA